MKADLYPLQWLLLVFSGWVNRQQQDVIEYLVEENRILKEQLDGRRLRLNDEQRRRLAAKGKRLGRRILNRVATIVTSDTILKLHRQLIASKWTFERKKPGRPGVLKEITRLVVQMAEENPSWGYSRIQGALKNLGHRVARSTIARILKDHGIESAPDRPTSWSTFLGSHWGAIVAADFFTTEVWIPSGLTTYDVLFLIDLKSRRVHIAGITPNPDDSFMVQVARNLTDALDGFLLGQRFLICDRDTKFSTSFKTTLLGSGVELIRTPYQAPNCNAYAERFIRSLREECLDRMVLFGEISLRRILSEYLEHYHGERNHQGLENELIESRMLPITGDVESRERLGGVLRYYYRAA